MKASRSPRLQRACLLLRQLRYVRQAPKIPIVLVEPNEVPSYVAKELEAREEQHRPRLDLTLIGSKRLETGSFRVRTPSDYTESEHHLSLLGSDIIIIGSDAYHRMAEYLPPYAVFRPGRYELSAVSDSRVARLRDLTGYDVKKGPIALATEELNHDWSHEVSWRLNRAYELKVSKNQKARQNWESQINDLLPVSQNVEQRIEEVRSIALPSVLECLQDGFADGRGRVASVRRH